MFCPQCPTPHTTCSGGPFLVSSDKGLQRNNLFYEFQKTKANSPFFFEKEQVISLLSLRTIQRHPQTAERSVPTVYLKTLEIQGFKSFAEKITLSFHSGLTAVVGPNGSGKSNI